jgi:hypothetical protein
MCIAIRNIIGAYVSTILGLTVWAWEDRRNADITPAFPLQEEK